MGSPYLPDWPEPARRPARERVSRVQRTGLFVTFDESFDQVWIQRGEDLSDERGDGIRMTMAEWTELVDQARKIRALATPRWWGSHQQPDTHEEHRMTQQEKPPATQVISLEDWNEGGWVWEIRHDEATRRYRTDRDFEGLWVWVLNGPSGEWRQTHGHLQAHCPRDRAGMIEHLRAAGHDVSHLTPA